MSEFVDSTALVLELGQYKYDKLFCWSQDGTVVADADFVEHVIDTAEAEVKALLYRLYNYTPDGTNVPPALGEWALNLALANAYRARGYDEIGAPYKARADNYKKLAEERHLGPEWEAAGVVVLSPRRMPVQTTSRAPVINAVRDDQYL